MDEKNGKNREGNFDVSRQAKNWDKQIIKSKATYENKIRNIGKKNGKVLQKCKEI